jgi:hypothetical protein
MVFLLALPIHHIRLGFIRLPLLHLPLPHLPRKKRVQHTPSRARIPVLDRIQRIHDFRLVSDNQLELGG